MSLDLSFPYTGSTTWASLYAGLRANFSALNDKFINTDSWHVPTLGTNWLTDAGQYQSKYMKDAFGWVVLIGVCWTTNSTNPVFTLTSSSYYPARTISLTAGICSDAIAIVTISSSNGQVTTNQSNGSTVSLVLSGLRFYTGG